MTDCLCTSLYVCGYHSLEQDRDEWRQVARDWRVRAESAEAEVRRLREQVAESERKLMDAYQEIRELHARLRDFELGLL